MNDKEDAKSIEPRSNAISRRDLIKGVIVGGVAVSSASYLFRASTLLGQSARGMGERLVTIDVNGQLRRADEAGLRPGRMRVLYRSYRRCAALCVLGADTHRA